MPGKEIDLGLMSSPARPSPPYNPHLSPYVGGRLTKQQKHLVEDIHSAQLAIDGGTLLTIMGEWRIAQIYSSGTLAFFDTAGLMLELRDQAFSEDLKGLMNQFVAFAVKSFAMDLKAIMEAGGQHVLTAVNTPLRVERDTRGFFAKLLDLG